MSVTTADVRKVARLARIGVGEDRLALLAKELSGIFKWIKQLQSVDVSGVEPMTSVTDAQLPMREDNVTDGNKCDQILQNAPRSEDDFFVVPKAVE